VTARAACKLGGSKSARRIDARLGTAVLSSVTNPPISLDWSCRIGGSFQPLSRYVDVSMTQALQDQAVLLMAHGSRDAEARAEYRRIHAALSARMAPHPVIFSVLEFPGDDGLPSIQDGWRQCLEAGARRIVAFPFFLFPAGHVREDLPNELLTARNTGGWAELDVLPPLGAPDELLDAIEARAQEAIGVEGAADTAMILVGAGTSDPDANGDLCKAARLLWERFRDRYALVETAWVSLTRPSIAEAIDRCIRLGATRIALVPYFLNTGILLKRIDARIAETRTAHPEISITRGSHLGLQPRLLDLLERRAREGLDGNAATNGLTAVCDRPSCAAVATGRRTLLQATAPAR
jgi:sirohydrochlorin cobaltochelatase